MFNLSIVDDHDLFREMLVNYVNSTGHFKISLSTDDPCIFLNALTKENYPDLLILDLRLKEESGVNIIKAIRQKGYSFKILAFTMFHNDKIMSACISAGANGYITKNIQSEQFILALQDIIINDSILIEDEEQKYVFRKKADLLISNRGSINITKREMEFLILCAHADLTYKEIAYKLEVSPKTIDKFRESLFKKLQVKSKTEMILYAKEHMLI